GLLRTVRGDPAARRAVAGRGAMGCELLATVGAGRSADEPRPVCPVDLLDHAGLLPPLPLLPVATHLLVAPLGLRDLRVTACVAVAAVHRAAVDRVGRDDAPAARARFLGKNRPFWLTSHGGSSSRYRPISVTGSARRSRDGVLGPQVGHDLLGTGRTE